MPRGLQIVATCQREVRIIHSLCKNEDGSCWHSGSLQLAGNVKCPRHRRPKFDPATALLTGTKDGTLVNVYLRILVGNRRSLFVSLFLFSRP
ncbi:unnamed protein product [Microthlaspi erraticum]|uniref:Uncharacterized protein n=1 Tax=Microthlaspi erraticum TaxID=1685480 RepID=A0A6D2K277_9BRAS|nr:unnamed protein product [Microthlaspi erraticum]